MPAGVVKRNGISFNKVGGIQEKWTSRSSQQDANIVCTKEAGLRITLLNYWIISCANSVGTKHVSFTYFFDGIGVRAISIRRS
jgi:hypothetical protein